MLCEQALWDSLMLDIPHAAADDMLKQRRKRELRLTGSLQSVCMQPPACRVQAALC